MTVKEHGFARMSEDVEATIWRLRETIRVAELADTHRLRQMRRLLMHEKHKTWKREFGFDRIETAAEMDEKRSRTSTSPASDPFFYRNIIIPRRPHKPDNFTLEIKVNVEGLRMGIIPSQPASSQCDPSPRRAAVDTGSEEPRKPPRSPAIGTGSEEPGASRAPFKTSIDGFLYPNFTSTEQECVLLHQPDVGVDDENKETTATLQQAAVREEFVSPTEKRQQQGTTTWATEQNKQFDRGRSYIGIVTFLEKRMFACRVYYFACFSLLFCLRSLLRTFPVLSTNCQSRYERRYELFGCTGCMNCCIRREAFTISIFRR